jgi:hypothetical protein
MTYQKIVLRTHGGLGNQLFQYFYARVISIEQKIPVIEIVHEQNYKHRFELASEFDQFRIDNEKYLLSRLRIAKIFEKLKINAGIMTFNGTMYLDGYFQNDRLYMSTSKEVVDLVIVEIKSLFKIALEKNENTINHMRLGDFFLNEYEESQHLLSRINNLLFGSHLISNRDDLIKRKIILTRLKFRNIKHIETSSYSASEILRLLSTYSCIISNGSTLAFWSAVLSNSRLEIGAESLNSLYKIFLLKAKT